MFFFFLRISHVYKISEDEVQLYRYGWAEAATQFAIDQIGWGLPKLVIFHLFRRTETKVCGGI